MVIITGIETGYDAVEFDELPASEMGGSSPRVTKSQTLDGGVSFDHRGFVTADRQFRFKSYLSDEMAERFNSIYENETYVHLACKEGFFTGVIAQKKIDNGLLDMTFWVKEQNV
jgi:hypothetical protein